MRVAHIPSPPCAIVGLSMRIRGNYRTGAPCALDGCGFAYLTYRYRAPERSARYVCREVNKIYLFRFEPNAQRWVTVAPMVQKRSGLAAVVLNGYIYAFGGFDGVNRLNSVEMYYPSMDKWVEVCSMSAR